MKKISVFALLSAVALSAYAEQSVIPEASVAESAVVPSSEILLSQPDGATQKEYGFLHGVQLGVGVSATSGLNGFVGYVNKDFDSFWAKRFGVRFDFATTKPVRSVINNMINDVVGDGVDLGDSLTLTDFDIGSNHYAALVDFYPFGDMWLLGGWRLTGGYYVGELRASASIAGTISELDGGSYEFDLMGHQFKYVGNSVRGTASLDWDYRGPYLGTGFDIGLIAGLKIYVDAGVVFTNKSAQLGLNLPFENLYMDGAPVNNQTIKGMVNDVVDETLADAQSDLDDYKFYPMLKFGIMYRF